MLSLIESDSTMPAVATLMKIAGALGVKASDLLEPDVSNGTVFTSAAEYDDADTWIKTSNGYSFYAFASGRRDKSMQPYLFVAEKCEVKNHVFSHEGEEFIFVLSGKMKYKVGSLEYEMNAGDVVYFNSLEEHLVIPLSPKVKYLAIFTGEKSCEDK